MGVLYTVAPLDKETRAWLKEEGIPCPRKNGRDPTPEQLATAVNSLEGYEVEFNINENVWQAEVIDPNDPEDTWTMLNVGELKGTDQPCDFYFEKGNPELILEVTHAIAKLCGPMVIVPDTGCPPVVIEAKSDTKEIAATWEHITG